jgi:imidazole glycerol-phosphate synthase subunit HisF
LIPRIIPCLLLSEGRLVKTTRFRDPRYVGDPINAVRIFNEKEVDELIVLDIDASVQGREPDYETIRHLAAECRMPLCYGGGVRDSKQIERIVSLGVEKVALSAGFIERPEVVRQAGESVGSQSVVVVLDAKMGAGGRYEVYTHNGTRPTGRSAVELARQAEELGAGELVINSIDNDGRMKGYDLDLVGQIRDAIDLPMTCLGGASSLADMQRAIGRFGTMGVAAGSLFVFKGPYRAVLINYPDRDAKDALILDRTR